MDKKIKRVTRGMVDDQVHENALDVVNGQIGEQIARDVETTIEKDVEKELKDAVDAQVKAFLDPKVLETLVRERVERQTNVENVERNEDQLVTVTAEGPVKK